MGLPYVRVKKNQIFDFFHTIVLDAFMHSRLIKIMILDGFMINFSANNVTKRAKVFKVTYNHCLYNGVSLFFGLAT